MVKNYILRKFMLKDNLPNSNQIYNKQVNTQSVAKKNLVDRQEKCCTRRTNTSIVLPPKQNHISYYLQCGQPTTPKFILIT